MTTHRWKRGGRQNSKAREHEATHEHDESFEAALRSKLGEDVTSIVLAIAMRILRREFQHIVTLEHREPDIDVLANAVAESVKVIDEYDKYEESVRSMGKEPLPRRSATYTQVQQGSSPLQRWRELEKRGISIGCIVRWKLEASEGEGDFEVTGISNNIILSLRNVKTGERKNASGITQYEVVKVKDGS